MGHLTTPRASTAPSSPVLSLGVRPGLLTRPSAPSARPLGVPAGEVGRMRRSLAGAGSSRPAGRIGLIEGLGA
jgi:hypothetical protein